VCHGAGKETIRGCRVVVGEANEHTTKRVSLRETEETANERRGCCLARTRRALLLLLKAMGASLDAILAVGNCGMWIESRCDRGHRSRQDPRVGFRRRGSVSILANQKLPFYPTSNHFLNQYHSATSSIVTQTGSVWSAWKFTCNCTKVYKQNLSAQSTSRL
jgi:hypothetical protein